jgi:hypothetical protein
MKKRILVAAVLGLIFTTSGFSQEGVKPFQHLSLGVEAGITGIGIELAAPLHKNFTLRGGFSTFPLNLDIAKFAGESMGFSVDLKQAIKDKIDNAVNVSPNLKSDLEANGLPTKADDIDNKIAPKLKFGLANAKILIDYYPTVKSSFHFTAGAYYGSNYLLGIEGGLSKQTSDMIDMLAKHKDDMGFDINEEQFVDGYQINARDLGSLDARISTKALKPYFGFGFGRAVPKSRLGMQFDLGALYHGTPKLTSGNSQIQKLLDTEIGGDAIAIMEKVTFYPVISLKITYRIF